VKLPLVIVAELKVRLLHFHFLEIMHEPILRHVACNIGDNVALNEINLRLSVVPASTEFLCDSFDEIFLFDFKFLIVLLQCEFPM